MRHGRKINHLGRTSSHRKALLKNMTISLILHKKISTTVAKAKALRKYVEPLLTKAKTDSTHSRRIVFAYLQDKEAVKMLFDEVSRKITDRNGGYTRIIKTEKRLGDNAEMCIMELVDYNTIYVKEGQETAKKTRRSRRGSGKGAATQQTTAAEAETPKVEALPKEEQSGEGQVQENA
ncbi:MAG: 50S ribosomal protein L17 [Bernardetiaceae bacterium]|jgi:large subunit ribosomal protein L17|nr:50S ribosomal protein L17 [Bernardetiaceae bacterium]